MGEGVGEGPRYESGYRSGTTAGSTFSRYIPPGAGANHAEGPARILRWVLAAILVLTVASVVVAIRCRSAVHGVADGTVTPGDASAELELYQTLEFWTGLLLIAAGVLSIVCMWRLANDQKRLGRLDPTFGPAWAIGGWFIPVANMVIPFIQFRELWKGSDPAVPAYAPDWKRAPVPVLLWVWWVAFVVASTSSLIFQGGFADRPEKLAIDLDAFDGTVLRAIITNAAFLIASALYLIVVTRLTSRQSQSLAQAPAG